MPKIYVYIHVCCINNWQDVFRNMLHQIHESGLYDKINEIRTVVIGDIEEFKRLFSDPKIKVIDSVNEDMYLESNYIEETNYGKFWFHALCPPALKTSYNFNSTYKFNTQRPFHNEEIILKKLHKDSLSEEFYVLYMHTKGVKRFQTSPDLYPNVKDWVDLLLYFNLFYHNEMIEELNTFDAAGVNLYRPPNTPDGEVRTIRFGGNFWWSKSSYIRKLNPAIRNTYGGPEEWIIDDMKGSFMSVWNSSINHYDSPYPSEIYRNKPLQRHIISPKNRGVYK